MRCFSSAVGVNTTTLIRWKRNKLHFSHEEEEWGTIQRTDAFFTVYRQTPSHSLKKDFDCFVYFSDSRLSVFVLFDVIYIFLRRNIQWVFFLSLSKLSIFWWWLKVTSKNWFENQKPRQGKSHRLTNFLVAHCSTKVGIFVCLEKTEEHGRSQGWLIYWKDTGVMSNWYTSCVKLMNNSK